jgi:hypothetical protein
MGVEKLQNGPAFLFLEAHQALRVGGVYEESLAAAARMDSHDGMSDLRIAFRD